MKPGWDTEDLPLDPQDLPMLSYNKVHDPKNPQVWGAYIAEILGPNFLGRDVLVGDGQNTLAFVGQECPACQSGGNAQLLRQVQFRESGQRYKRYVCSIGCAIWIRWIFPNILWWKNMFISGSFFQILLGSFEKAEITFILI